MPTLSAICPTRIFPTQPRSCWCKIISAPTSPPRSMRPFRPPRHDASQNASNGTTRPSMAAGSTWQNPIGNSQPQMLALSSKGCILNLNDSGHYTTVVLSDQDLGDIYAYLLTIP